MNRINELRKEQGMKQLALAELLKVSQQTVSRYEKGERDLDTDAIRRLCEIFGVTADYLLGFTSQRVPRLPEEDAELLAAYHAAPESVRQGITALLEPYRKEAAEDAG